MLSNVRIFAPALLIPIIVKLLAATIQKTPPNDKEKISPFECGFDPLSKSRIPFSLRFFLLSVLFLVFDVEVAIILCLPLAISLKPLWIYAPPLVFFRLILLLGLYHEWNEGTISWKPQKQN